MRVRLAGVTRRSGSTAAPFRPRRDNCVGEATAEVSEVHIDRSWHWTVSSSLALCATTAGLFATRGWHWLGVPPIGPDRPPFSDTHAQLMAADA